MIHDQGKMEFNGFLKQLIKTEFLEDAALGITKYIIDHGREKLTSKQNFIFQKEIMDKFVHEECEMCHQEIPWPEITFAVNKDVCVLYLKQIILI